MKNYLKFIVLILFTSISAVSQTEISSSNCNTLKVSLNEDVNTVAKVLLEQQFKKDVWMKIAQKTTEKDEVLFTGLSNGEYRATYVTKGTKWQKDKYISNTIEIKCGKDERERLLYSLSPNPSKDIVNVNIQLKDKFHEINYEIFDRLGISLIEGKSEKQFFKIDLSSFISGIYYIKVDVDGKYDFKQFIISK